MSVLTQFFVGLNKTFKDSISKESSSLVTMSSLTLENSFGRKYVCHVFDAHNSHLTSHNSHITPDVSCDNHDNQHQYGANNRTAEQEEELCIFFKGIHLFQISLW